MLGWTVAVHKILVCCLQGVLRHLLLLNFQRLGHLFVPPATRFLNLRHQLFVPEVFFHIVTQLQFRYLIKGLNLSQFDTSKSLAANWKAPGPCNDQPHLQANFSLDLLDCSGDTWSKFLHVDQKFISKKGLGTRFLKACTTSLIHQYFSGTPRENRWNRTSLSENYSGPTRSISTVTISSRQELHFTH